MKMKSNKVNQLNPWSRLNLWSELWNQLVSTICFINFFLSKINTYKIKYEPNIKMIEKKIKTNYVVQLVINQILSDKTEKKISKKLKKINSNG